MARQMWATQLSLTVWTVTFFKDSWLASARIRESHSSGSIHDRSMVSSSSALFFANASNHMATGLEMRPLL
ncbi:hypothetical protein MRX96_021857 [Rhipicephalus microplus]